MANATARTESAVWMAAYPASHIDALSQER